MNELQKHVSAIQKSAESDPRFKQHEEVEITPEAVNAVEMIFASMLPHFPAWRQSCPTNEDLGRLKAAWTKAIIRHSRKTGKKPNFKAGIVACEESDTDWLPSVGKFLKWCEQENNLAQFAQRALNLFNSGQKQIDTVGKMVTAKHHFDLKQMKAVDTNKRFIELYLFYAENNAIEPLKSNLLTETVQLTPEQQKEANKRASEAQNQFLNQFAHLKQDEPPKKKVKPVKSGLITAKQKAPVQTQAQIEEVKRKQLEAIKGKLNG